LGLYQKSSTAPGAKKTILIKGQRAEMASDWSLDGRFILYTQTGSDTQADLWVIPLFGDRQPIPFLQTKFNERNGVFLRRQNGSRTNRMTQAAIKCGSRASRLAASGSSSEGKLATLQARREELFIWQRTESS